MAHGEGHGIEGGTLGLDDHRAGLPHPLHKRLVIAVEADVLRVGGVGGVAAHMVVGNGGQGPGHEGGISVLAVNVGMDVLGADVELPGQLRLQPGRIQHRAGADDPLRGNAGDLVEHIGHHVHRVGDHDVNGLRGVFYNVGGDLLEDVHIGLGQLQPGLPGLPGHAGGDDDNGGTHRILIPPRTDHRRGCKAGALVNIHGLSEGLLLVDVDKQNFRGNIHGHQVIGNGRPHAARSDDGDFCTHGSTPFMGKEILC